MKDRLRQKNLSGRRKRETQSIGESRGNRHGEIDI